MPAILLVDDEPMILAMLALTLESEGCSVLTAGSAAEAISIFRSYPSEIDLLITDVVMPTMSGPRLAAELLIEDSGLPVLFMSGSCEEVPFGTPYQFGFLAKPFALKDLVAEVWSLMRRQVATVADHRLARQERWGRPEEVECVAVSLGVSGDGDPVGEGPGMLVALQNLIRSR